MPHPVDLPSLSITASVGEIVAELRRHGGVVIKGLIEHSAVNLINAELDTFVASRSGGFGSDDDFYGSRTVRVQGLAAKSPTFVLEVLLNDLMKGVADEVLLPNCGTYWMSQAETIFIRPGNPAQQLHRDDLNWRFAQELRRDIQVSVLVALGDYDTEVGATMVVPGSHLLPLDQQLDPATAVPVEMNPGDGLIYLGSLVHGGGANRTTDRIRKALYMGFLVGWLTPEEAVALGVPDDLAASLPERARQLLGWGRGRGNPDESGAAAALKLWQLDHDDPRRRSGFFA